MAETFFKNFPITTYNGSLAIDITKSIRMDPTIFTNPFSFNEYKLKAGERSDFAADDIYGDPYMEWLVFMSNRQLDPYAWYMDYDEFYDYVNQKYGDWLVAQNKIKYYVNNWYTDIDNPLVPGAYDALLPHLTKYYDPVYDHANNITQYVRKQVNWEVTTNHIVKCYFTTNVATLTLDEIINVTWSNNVSGNGQVAFSNSSTLIFQHVTGNYMPVSNVVDANTFQIYGQESNNTVTIAHANQISVSVIDVLDPTEDVFYDAVSYFDYENMLNESRKNIVVIDSGYAQQLLQDFKRAFNS